MASDDHQTVLLNFILLIFVLLAT